MNKQAYYMYKQAFVAPRKGQPGYAESHINFNLGELLPGLGTALGALGTAYGNKTGNKFLSGAGKLLNTAGRTAYTMQHPVTSIGANIGSAIGRSTGNPYGGIIGGIAGALPGLFGQAWQGIQDYRNNPYNYIMY